MEEAYLEKRSNGRKSPSSFEAIRFVPTALEKPGDVFSSTLGNPY